VASIDVGHHIMLEDFTTEEGCSSKKTTELEAEVFPAAIYKVAKERLAGDKKQKYFSCN